MNLSTFGNKFSGVSKNVLRSVEFLRLVFSSIFNKNQKILGGDTSDLSVFGPRSSTICTVADVASLVCPSLIACT